MNESSTNIEDKAVSASLPKPPGVTAKNWNDPEFKGWAHRGIRMLLMLKEFY